MSADLADGASSSDVNDSDLEDAGKIGLASCRCRCSRREERSNTGGVDGGGAQSEKSQSVHGDEMCGS